MSEQGRERSGATAGKGVPKDIAPTKARSGALTEGSVTAANTQAPPQEKTKEASDDTTQWKSGQRGKDPPKNPGTLGKGTAATARNAARNPVFLSGRYAINAYIWRASDQYAEATGSILSQSLDKSILSQAPEKYAGDISLGQLRKLTPGWWIRSCETDTFD